MSIAQTKDGFPIISSARDIGNIAAGYMAGIYGFTWDTSARLAFDALEAKQGNPNGESISSQNAQRLGYNIGISIYHTNLLKTLIYPVFSTPQKK